MIPKLSPAALSLNLGAGQPGFGQAPGTEEENEFFAAALGQVRSGVS